MQTLEICTMYMNLSNMKRKKKGAEKTKAEEYFDVQHSAALSDG